MTDKARDIIEDLRARGCDDKEIMYAICDGEYLAKRPDITQDLAEEVYDIMVALLRTIPGGSASRS
jgi:hypothetical protein